MYEQSGLNRSSSLGPKSAHEDRSQNHVCLKHRRLTQWQQTWQPIWNQGRSNSMKGSLCWHVKGLSEAQRSRPCSLRMNVLVVPERLWYVHSIWHSVKERKGLISRERGDLDYPFEGSFHRQVYLYIHMNHALSWGRKVLDGASSWRWLKQTTLPFYVIKSFYTIKWIELKQT